MGINDKTNNLKRVVFLDRDGVINDMVFRGENFEILGKKVPWSAPFRYNEFKIKPGVRESLQKMREAGWLNILTTNQPDVAYGFLPAAEHERIMAEVKALPLDDIYICLHTRYANCECKKPKAGMLFSAAKKWNIDLSASIMIGDSASDMGAARAAGCKFILINHETNAGLDCEVRVNNLNEAIKLIINSKYENIH